MDFRSKMKVKLQALLMNSVEGLAQSFSTGTIPCIPIDDTKPIIKITEIYPVAVIKKT